MSRDVGTNLKIYVIEIVLAPSPKIKQPNNNVQKYEESDDYNT
jgi:hypothetical protein